MGIVRDTLSLLKRWALRQGFHQWIWQIVSSEITIFQIIRYFPPWNCWNSISVVQGAGESRTKTKLPGRGTKTVWNVLKTIPQDSVLYIFKTLIVICVHTFLNHVVELDISLMLIFFMEFLRVLSLDLTFLTFICCYWVMLYDNTDSTSILKQATLRFI